jgi:hypothetical protein
MEKSYLLKINYIGFYISLKTTAKFTFQTASLFTIIYYSNCYFNEIATILSILDCNLATKFLLSFAILFCSPISLDKS